MIIHQPYRPAPSPVGRAQTKPPPGGGGFDVRDAGQTVSVLIAWSPNKPSSTCWVSPAESTPLPA